MDSATLPALTTSVRLPELLAPAGDWDCVRAAVENGADAVYFGLNHGFNARARATNFSLGDVAAVMEFLRRRGVKGYVTLNTLVFTDELPEIEQTLQILTTAGVDAVLVQDMGLVRLIRALSPDLPIHASTQMTITSAECLAVAAELGIERAVLARELSIREIGKIRERSSTDLEVFVHGALCVAYSGQCLTSESLGGRSANRGQCAQACRLTYDLVCDGEDVDLGAMRYLLSPQDLAAYELTPQLLAAGVQSFKIEGRLKTPEYVANITRHYRRAIDAAVAGHAVEFTPQDVREMELSFSRGFSPGWLHGCDHKQLVPGLSSAKRGVHLGTVTQIFENAVEVRLTAPVRRGDGVVFDGDRSTNDEQGGRIFGVFRGRQRCDEAVSSGLVQLEFARDSLDLARIALGQSLWKTDDPELTNRLRASYSGPDPVRKVGLSLTVQATVGEPLVLRAQTETGVVAEARSEALLALAAKHPADEEFFRRELDRLGHTVYRLDQVEVSITGQPHVPLSVMSATRRALIAALDQRNGLSPQRRLSSTSALAELRRALPDVAAARAAQRNVCPQLRVLCRSREQLDAVLDIHACEVVLDFSHIREYRPAIAACRARGVPVMIATPRIQKPVELGIFRVLARYAPDSVLVRNLAGMRYFAQRRIPFVADFSLNATNELTVQYLIEQGASRVTASYDLNREQMLSLADVVPPQWLEIVLHQHMPMFHMEHCVFCAVLSPGTNKTNCGRPCDRHEVKLRDRIGMEHRLNADVGCRNTLFNAVPQSGAELTAALLERGVWAFRLELLDESADEIADVIRLYQRLLAGEIRGEEVWRQLKAANRVGVTRGTLEERRNPLAIL